MGPRMARGVRPGAVVVDHGSEVNVNPMAKWGDKGMFQGRDGDSRLMTYTREKRRIEQQLRECPVCGNKFWSTSPRQKTCSRRCGGMLRIRTAKKSARQIQCAGCGKSFAPVSDKHRFCTKSCRLRARYLMMKSMAARFNKTNRSRRRRNDASEG